MLKMQQRIGFTMERTGHHTYPTEGPEYFYNASDQKLLFFIVPVDF